MKKLLIPLLILAGCRSWGGTAQDKKLDPRDTVQKPLPDSILVRDTAIKDIEVRKTGEQ